MSHPEGTGFFFFTISQFHFFFFLKTARGGSFADPSTCSDMVRLCCCFPGDGRAEAQLGALRSEAAPLPPPVPSENHRAAEEEAASSSL